MAKNTTSKSQEGYYAQYKSQAKWKTNRQRKLLKTQKEQPNNDKIRLALLDINYRRKVPKTRMWSSTARKEAQLLKEFCGKAPLACFSSNPKTRSEALQSLHLRTQDTSVHTAKVSFSILERSHG